MLPTYDSLLRGLPGYSAPVRPLIRQQRPAVPTLTQEEEDSLVSELISGSLGGLQYIGETFDKPGRAIRGTLSGLTGGDWGGGLLNLIPFSDSMGITDPSKSVDGRELLEQTGLIGSNTDGLDTGDVLGFGVEMLTDPLTYLTLGGSTLTKGGRIAKAVGKMPASRMGRLTGTLDDIIRQAPVEQADDLIREMTEAATKQGTTLDAVRGEKLGGMFGFGLPFSESSLIPKVAQGERAQQVASALDKTGAFLGDTAPVRGLNALFDHKSGGKFGIFEQRLARSTSEVGEYSKRVGREAELMANKAFDGVQHEFSEAFADVIKHSEPPDDPQLLREWTIARDNTARELLSDTVQTLVEVEDLDKAVGILNRANGTAKDIHKSHPELFKKLQGVAQQFKSYEDDIHKTFQQMGGKSSDLQSVLGHLFRKAEVYKEPPKGTLKALATTHAGEQRRLESLYNLPKVMVDAMVQDKGLRGKGAMKNLLSKWGDRVEESARNKFERALEKAVKKKTSLHDAGKDKLADLVEIPEWSDDLVKQEAKGILKYIKQKPADIYTEEGRKVFVSNIAESTSHYQQGAQKAIGNAEAIHKAFGDVHFDPDEATHFWDEYETALAEAAEEGVKLSQPEIVLSPTGITSGKMVPLDKAFKQVGMDSKQAKKYFQKLFPDLDAERHLVPEELVGAAAAQYKAHTNQEYQSMLFGAISGVTNFIKKNLVLPFPATWSRNAVGAHYMNITASGAVHTAGDFKAYTDNMIHAGKVQAGKLVDQDLLDEVYTMGLYSNRETGTHDLDYIGSVTKGVLPGNPLDIKDSYKAVSESHVPTRELLDGPTARKVGELAGGRGGGIVDGIDSARKVYDTAMETGARAMGQVEFNARVGMYRYLRKHKGYSKEAAKKLVDKLQINYSELAPFEKTLRSSAVPFYTFARKNIPVLIENLIEKPGGAVAQSVRLSNQGRDEKGFTPTYVGEGMAFRLGENKYLSSLGLPVDQFGELAAFGQTPTQSVVRTGQKLSSMLNPLAKLGIEGMTGTDLFTGRPLEEGYQFPTNSVLGNRVISNSPLGRYVTTARKLVDDRKAPWEKVANLLTGVRTTDVYEGSRDMELKKMLTEKLRGEYGIKGFHVPHISSDRIAQEPVESRERLMKFNTLMRGMQSKARKAHEEKKKQAKVFSDVLYTPGTIR